MHLPKENFPHSRQLWLVDPLHKLLHYSVSHMVLESFTCFLFTWMLSNLRTDTKLFNPAVCWGHRGLVGRISVGDVIEDNLKYEEIWIIPGAILCYRILTKTASDTVLMVD